MIKAEGSTPSTVSAFNPQRIFLLDTHTNSLGVVYANCRGVWAGKGGELLREGQRMGKQRQTPRGRGSLPSPHRPTPPLLESRAGRIQGCRAVGWTAPPGGLEGADTAKQAGPPPPSLPHSGAKSVTGRLSAAFII